MCGFAGFIEAGVHAGRDLAQIAGRMAGALAHRGPDDAGVWEDSASGVALAHRRLAVVDLSDAGHQPMLSASARYVLTLNGEIYNHNELRAELEGSLSQDPPTWRGHSDTETLLAAIEEWGVESALTKTVGMFALVLWDRQSRTLTLARDRLGEKPLYYGWQRGVFLFASELKALKVHPAFEGQIDRDALTLFLRHNYIPAPYSVYAGVRKLDPGTLLQVSREDLHQRRWATARAYWSAREVAEKAARDPFLDSEDEAVDELERHLQRAITGQMVADVPVGAFLSGGVDSSTVVALMQAQSARPVQTFTIGFHEEDYNEAEHAQAVARHLGTEHIELYVSPAEALAVIPRLPSIYDEPFADSSQLPTFLISELTRRQVTVSLSGDGGDELFGGYNRYLWAAHIWQRLGRVPRPVRRAIAAAIAVAPPAAWDRLFSALSSLLPPRLRYLNAGDKLHKLAEILAVRGAEEIYTGLVSHWKSPASVVVGGREPPTVLTNATRWAELAEFEHRMMYLDLISYLPDDILVKVDRAAMAVSLETRVPFLDHRVVEFAWRLPLSMKIRDRVGKRILRKLLYRYVPEELIERPKMGFGVPIDTWLRGPLRDWAESLLDVTRLRGDGYFEPEPIRQKWDEHLAGKRNWQYYLWDILMFQAWLDDQSAERTGEHAVLRHVHTA